MTSHTSRSEDTDKDTIIEFFNAKCINIAPPLLPETLPIRDSEKQPRLCYTYPEPHFQYINAFIRALESTVVSPGADPQLIEDGDIGYQFPSEEITQSYVNNYLDEPSDGGCFGNYINCTAAHVDAFLQSLLADVQATPSPALVHGNTNKVLRFITGKVGSGKTTFINYLLRATSLQHHYEDYNVVRCAIAYDFIDTTLRANSLKTQDTIADYFKSVVLNNLVIAVLSSTRCRALLNTVSFIEYITVSLQGSYSFEDIKKQKDYLVACLHSFGKQYVGTYDICADNLSQSMKATILNYLHYEHSVKFLVILDGLDRLSASDVTSEKFKTIFAALGSTIYSISFLTHQVRVTVHYLVVLRNCTYERFIHNNYERLVGERRNYIVPVDVDRVINRVTEDYLRRNSSSAFHIEHATAFRDFTKYIITTVSHALVPKTHTQLAEIFEYDLRTLLKYILDVWVFICYRIVRETNPHSFDLLIEALNSERINKRILKPYILIETLLLSKHSGFENCFTTSKLLINTTTTGGYEPNEPIAGYVDNVFNYSLTGGPVPPLLIKVRLLQYLKEHRYRRSDDIKHYLIGLGYPISDKALELLLSIMTRKIIKVRSFGNELHYAINGMGRFILERLVCRLAYVEQVVHTTLFPDFVTQAIHVMRQEDIVSWVYASIRNAYVFLTYLTAVEECETKTSQLNSALISPTWLLNGILRQNIIESVKHIIDTPVREQLLDRERIIEELREAQRQLEPLWYRK